MTFKFFIVIYSSRIEVLFCTISKLFLTRKIPRNPLFAKGLRGIALAG